MSAYELEMCKHYVQHYSINALRAMAAQDYPAIAIELLGGGKIYWSDVIAMAEAQMEIAA